MKIFLKIRFSRLITILKVSPGIPVLYQRTLSLEFESVSPLSAGRRTAGDSRRVEPADAAPDHGRHLGPGGRQSDRRAGGDHEAP